MFQRVSWVLMAVVLVAGCRSSRTSPSTAPRPSGSVQVSEPTGLPPTDAGPMEDAGAVDAGDDPMPSVRITSPMTGAVFVQDAVVSSEWAAEVTFTVDATDVAEVELMADGTFSLGVAVDGVLTYAFLGEGTRAIQAIGRDASGAELARDEISIRIDPPADTSCHAMLTGLGIDFEPTGPTRGIADPVRVQPVINDVSFRYVSNSSPSAMLMDCELGLRLHALTELIKPYGIDEVIHIGIYNYRCIGGGDPDSGTCTPSQHAYARAIDIHAFGLADSNEEWSTETDWNITMRGDACPISSSSEVDRNLKEIACGMWADGIFQIILTPNYNAAHRNHFHVDLSEGSMYIGVAAAGVDPIVDGLGH